MKKHAGWLLLLTSCLLLAGCSSSKSGKDCTGNVCHVGKNPNTTSLIVKK